jgi:hypothetical protein
VFKASDYKISPFELESVHIEHPAVTEATVVPVPDPVRAAVPKAYIALPPGFEPTRETAFAILKHARENLAPFLRVGKIEFSELPKTISGKIRRVELRTREEELAVPVSLQPQYNLLVREIEWEIVPAAQANGLGLLPWSPLGGGWLTGKYRARSGRPVPPVSARTRDAGWRPTTGAAACSGPGTSSTRSGRWPGAAGRRWGRWRWPGWWTGRR